MNNLNKTFLPLVAITILGLTTLGTPVGATTLFSTSVPSNAVQSSAATSKAFRIPTTIILITDAAKYRIAAVIGSGASIAPQLPASVLD